MDKLTQSRIELEQFVIENGENSLLEIEILDPACDPEKPVHVDQTQIWDAYSYIRRVRADIRQSPCDKSRLSDALGMQQSC